MVSRRRPSPRSSIATTFADVGDDTGEHHFRSNICSVSAPTCSSPTSRSFGDSVKALSGMPSSASMPSPEGLRRAEQRHLVDQIARHECGRQDRARFDHHTRDAATAKTAQHGRKIEPPVRAGHAQHLDAEVGQRAFLFLRRCLARERPVERTRRARGDARFRRQPQFAVEHDAHRRARAPCRASGN